jgi:hypothetical protein
LKAGLKAVRPRLFNDGTQRSIRITRLRRAAQPVVVVGHEQIVRFRREQGAGLQRPALALPPLPQPRDGEGLAVPTCGSRRDASCRPAALKGLEQIYCAGYRYKKAGVMLNKLAPAEQLSMRLFGDERFEKSRRVMKAVDESNARHGRDTVRFGAARPGAGGRRSFCGARSATRPASTRCSGSPEISEERS